MAEVTRGEVRMLANMVASVGRDLRDFRRQHEAEHAAEARARVTSRRWLIGTLIALAAVIETPLLVLLARK